MLNAHDKLAILFYEDGCFTVLNIIIGGIDLCQLALQKENMYRKINWAPGLFVCFF